MSYAVYSTRGFILSSSPTGEASKLYSIYTEDFGLVRARAQGVRLLRSKLRYNLDDYAFIDVSLVRGKEVWRLTGAEKRDSKPLSRVAAPLRARVLNLVRRLVQGEERNDKLFAALLLLAADAPTGMPDEVDVLSRVLDSLGYLDVAALQNSSDRDKVTAINRALQDTQL